MTRRVVLSRLNVAQHAGRKAPADVRTVALRMGFSPVDLSPFDGTTWRSRLHTVLRAARQVLRALRPLTAADTLLVQHPLGRINDVLLAPLLHRTISVALVHDLESLRWPRYGRRELRSLARFDAVIAHTPAMAEHLRARLVGTPVVVLGCFDYLVEQPPILAPLAHRPEALMVAGRLDPDKAAYLYQVHDPRMPIQTYGPGCVAERLPHGVTHVGLIDMERPSLAERNAFGLVWDGTSPDMLVGPTGRYLQFNAPHKLSLYIALGLPVVVPREAAVAGLVESRVLGLTVGSVGEAADRVRSLPESEWRAMADAVERFREELLHGERTREALSRVLHD